MQNQVKPSTTSTTVETSPNHSAPPPTTRDAFVKDAVSYWYAPAIIAPNDFKFKSLSDWSFNTSVGCGHGCLPCYVPSVATNKQGPTLKEEYGVEDPDAEWGSYVLLRPWDEKKFLASLRKAEDTPLAGLKPDGNRAVIYCSTTDAYQVIHHRDPKRRRELNDHARFLVRRSLELIRDQSTLNVRILTRSPLAKADFDLLKSFGDRLMFGMSLPTSNNQLSKLYEPNAPAPSQRLATLQAARDAGLNIFVAMAPTYPESDEADLRRTLAAIKELNPLTVFHEPVNIRAENVKRIEEHAVSLGATLKTEAFATPVSWRTYALESLLLVERLANELGLGHCLHLWPDKSLGAESAFLELRKSKRSYLQLTTYENQRHEQNDRNIYEHQYLPWLNRWWHRISEWPGKK